MGRGKDAYLERYGAVSPFEGEAERKSRMAEIDRIEASFKDGTFRGDPDGFEAARIRLCRLKGIDPFGYDDPEDDDD